METVPKDERLITKVIANTAINIVLEQRFDISTKRNNTIRKCAELINTLPSLMVKRTSLYHSKEKSGKTLVFKSFS